LQHAGISHNKLLAKLASAMNKPNKQTIVTFRAVPQVMADLPMTKIRNFGGKVGEALSQLGCSTAADVQALPMATLMKTFGDDARAECAAMELHGVILLVVLLHRKHANSGGIVNSVQLPGQ
jgi:nucleotidyltransferase/DNA polymerase involved in DNA repair